MKVILLKDAGNLGNIGDEVEVKDGYARNYLIPGKIAMEASEGALRMLESARRKRERVQKQIKEDCEKLAEKLKSASCTISVEVGEEDKLFGSVTADMIAESLKAEGIEIDKRKIVLDEPIKALGVYNIKVNLHPEVKPETRVWVVKR